MATKSIAEILNTACKLKSKDEKVKWLRDHESLHLRNILILMYGKDSFEFNIPQTVPPYEESQFPDSQGKLYREARKLKYFVKGWGGENIHPYRREALFIQMLESVDKEDAKVLCRMLQQKPMKGLSVAVINEAFDNIIETNKGSKQQDG